MSVSIKLCLTPSLLRSTKNPIGLIYLYKKNGIVSHGFENLSNENVLKGETNVIKKFAENFLTRKLNNSLYHLYDLYQTVKPNMTKEEFAAKDLVEEYYVVFKNYLIFTDSIKLYIRHDFTGNGSFRNYPSTLYRAKLDLSFDIKKNQKDGGLDLIPLFYINNIFVENVEDVCEFLVLAKNYTYLLDERQYRMFKLLKKLNWQQYRMSPNDFAEKILVEIEKMYRVNRGNFFEEQEVAGKPIAQLLVKESAGFLLLYPQWLYDGIRVEGRYEPLSIFTIQGIKYRVKRDKEAEEDLLQKIIPMYKDFQNQITGHFYISVENAKKKNWFLKFYHQLLDYGIEMVGMDMLKNFRYSSYPISTQITIESIEDTSLLIQFKVSFGPEDVNLLELKRVLAARQRQILLSDTTLGVLDDEWIEKYSLIVKHGELLGKKILVPKWIMLFQRSAFENIDLPSSVITEDWWKEWDQWQQQETEVFPIPSAVQAILRPYQQKGFEWMYLLSKIGAGACLADDMGLGKTLQTICLLAAKLQDFPHQKHLIISPASLIYNWKYEIEKFAPSLKVAVYQGANRDFGQIGNENPDVIITSYATCRNDIELLNPIQWNTVVLDESHNIKNSQAQTTKAVLTLKGNMRVILSGTPIMNQTLDLYPQFSFILPSMFGSKEFFSREYANPIDKDRDTEKINQLKKLTTPFMLRRTKEQVATELPPKIESILWCEMGETQRKLYEEVRHSVKKSVFLDIKNHGLAKSKLNVLAGIMRLRQICSNPRLLTEYENATDESIKIDTLIEEITVNLKEQKLIIFSQFLSVLDILKERLIDKGIEFYSIDGSTPNELRQKQVNDFQNPENSVRVFLLSLKAGNAGITLTEANYVFLVDPWWNRQVEQQAIDRVYRIGQNKNVFAYRMICRDTIEERIIQLQQNKIKISEELITEDEGFVKNLTEEDLSFLFD